MSFNDPANLLATETVRCNRCGDVFSWATEMQSAEYIGKTDAQYDDCPKCGNDRYTVLSVEADY